MVFRPGVVVTSMRVFFHKHHVMAARQPKVVESKRRSVKPYPSGNVP